MAGSMTAPLISVLLSVIKTLRTMLCCRVRFPAHFKSVFSPFVRLCHESYVGWRTIGWHRRLLRYKAMVMSMTQGLSTNEFYLSTQFSMHPISNIDGVFIKNMDMILARWAEYLQAF